jgi:hypothetical protein
MSKCSQSVNGESKSIAARNNKTQNPRKIQQRQNDEETPKIRMKLANANKDKAVT